MKRTAFATIISVALVAQSGMAEPPAPSPDGEWTFATGKMGAGCALKGAMSVTRKADKSLACEFQATWSCEYRLPRAVVTQQTCTAKQIGSDVVITSKIKQITRVDPPEMADYMNENYAADHFKVKINSRGDEMNGQFHSYGQAPVIFRRKLDLIG